MTLNFHRTRAAIAALAATTTLAVAGCGSGDSGGGPPASQDPGFPVAITSALGTAQIPAKPKRVVTLGWGSTEAAVALGVIPVGMRDMKSDSGSADGILPWVADKLGTEKPKLLTETSKSVPLEEIAALKPDVILSVQSGLTAEQYAQLEAIAPTVAQPGKAWQTSWQDQTKIVAKALGKEPDADRLIAQTDKQIADAKAAHPEYAGKTVVSTSATTDAGLNFYFDTDPRVKLLEGLGFQSLPAVAKLRESAAEGKFAAPVSWENVPEYNADVLTAWFLDAGKQKATESNTVFTSLPAIQKKAYVPVTDPPLVFAVSSPNTLNMEWLLQRYTPLLTTAANNAR